MKCPKCGYLGFETTERCRNCGYDFSLSVTADSSFELPLRSSAGPEGALADFDLSSLETDSRSDPTHALDLDRLIGVSDTPDMSAPAATPAAPTQPEARAGRASASAFAQATSDKSAGSTSAVATPPPDEVQERYQPPPVPRPALPPLAVRRTTPEIARRRTPRTLRRDAAELPFQLDATAAAAAAEPATSEVPAPRIARIVAALVDFILLAGINAAVLYLTLAIVGLSFADLGVLPPVPMGAFLLLLTAGYLVTFTAAGGQTIGKMIVHLRVISEAGGRVEVPGAFLRAAGMTLTCLTLGLPYLPVLVTRDGRALHDRLAGTRVVKIA